MLANIEETQQLRLNHTSISPDRETPTIPRKTGVIETEARTSEDKTARRDRTFENKGGAGLDADFVEVYELHYDRVVRALELGGLDHASAEDAAQEAFARTLARWPRVRTGTNPPGYVYRAAFRIGRRWLRQEAPLLDEVRDHGDFDDEIATRMAIEAVIAAMPRRRRSCAVLHLAVGLSTKEVAKALGITEGTVRKQVERARADLRFALRDNRA